MAMATSPEARTARSHRPRQERVLAYVQVLESKHALQPEHAVPQANWAIDGLVAVGTRPSEGWGPLGEHIADRLVLIEHFSRPPSLRKLVRAHTKLGLVADLWHHGRSAQRTGNRVPLLLILSEGRPSSALVRLPQLIACGPHDTWRSERRTLGDVLLVDLKRLPDAPGYSVLRLFARPRSDAEARARVAALLADERVLPSTRERIQEAIMKGTIPSTEPEKKSMVERLREEGEQLGIRKGEALGIRKGIRKGEALGIRKGEREATLALVRELAGEDAVRELEAVEDGEALRARAVELLRSIPPR